MATTSTRPLADVIRRKAEEDGIEFVFAQFVDMNAKPSAKLVPITNWDSMVSEGAGFAGFAAGPIGQTPASPDMMAVPDLASYTAVPFKPGLARFACDITVEGEEWPYCPRTILRRQLARAKSSWASRSRSGWSWSSSCCARTADGGIELADPLDRLDQPCYDMKGLTRQYEFLSTLSRYVNQLGWGSYANDHEDANGQFESNFEFADALTTADRAIFFRYMVHAMAQERGMLATFMAKPFGHLTGNGGHFHMSLWDEDGAVDLFADADDPQGLGLSKLGYHFTAGLLKHASAYIAVTAPTVNSYKRLTTTAGTPTSGATWSPIFITYGANNRTQMLRVPGGHVEDRTVDGSCNPYLAMARDPGRRPGRRRERARPGPVQRRQPVHDDPRGAGGGAGSSCCRPTCWTRPATWRRTTSSARRWATPAPRTTWTTSSRPSRRSGTPTTSRSRPGRCSAT